MADGWLSKPFSLKDKNVWVAGHEGMVGSALARRLAAEGCEVLGTARGQLDLREQAAVRAWIQHHRPEVVVVAAAKVGGILANMSQPADFLYDNLMIAANIIKAARDAGVEKLLFLGSSCIYPKGAHQPLRPESLLSGAPEPTNEAYALAKIAGVKLCQHYRAQHGCDFISAMPCNLYGPGDRFDLQASHVIPALMMKAHAARAAGAQTMEVWGSGKPLREFLYVDDCADALVFLLKNYSGMAPVNIGSGQEISIAALARLVAAASGFEGGLDFDSSRPDGVKRKLMDSAPLFAAGWRPAVSLEEGLRRTSAWYESSQSSCHAA